MFGSKYLIVGTILVLSLCFIEVESGRRRGNKTPRETSPKESKPSASETAVAANTKEFVLPEPLAPAYEPSGKCGSQCPHGCHSPVIHAVPWDLICSCDDLGIKDFLGQRSSCTACMEGTWIGLTPAWCLKTCNKCPEGCTKAEADPAPWDMVCDCQHKRCIACRNGDFVGLAPDNRWCTEEDKQGLYPTHGAATRQLARNGALRPDTE